jgi:lipoprotein-anchoring transpeptidase ErfK/SrfK
MVFGLQACIPVDGPEGVVPVAAAVPPPAPVADTVYVSRQDGAFSIPALPVEQIPEEFRRQTVAYVSDHAPGTIIVNPAAKHLLFITGPDQAIRYGIAVGKAGFEWSGEAVVSGRRTWPNWTPPPEMIARKPELAKWAGGQPGGPDNPLGARALYLTTNGVDYGYRIHGTPEWKSIGRNASSGCIRMINQDVIDLYARVPEGARVIVMTRDGQMPTGLSLPPPAPKPAAVRPKPQAKPAAPTEAAPAAPFGEPDLPEVPVPPPVII